MKSPFTALGIFAGALLLLIVAAATAAAEPLPPMVGRFTQAQYEEALRQAQGAVNEGHDGENHVPVPVAVRAEDYGDEQLRLLAEDNDTAHYLHGHTMILHIFVNHNGGTWNMFERAFAGAKGQVARQYFRDNAPALANVEFDQGVTSGYYYYNPTVDRTIFPDGMHSTIIEEAIADMGFDDADSDGSLIDDMTLAMQNTRGGFDNVIAVFQPADCSGTSSASQAFGLLVQYENNDASLWAWSMGYTFGSCFEFEEGGHCSGTTDCGLCQSWYLTTEYDNGNCALAACPSDVPCLMRDGTFDNICPYTVGHWAWQDTNNNGILDPTRRRVSGENFVDIYQMPDGTVYTSGNGDHGYAYQQAFTSWAVAGVRSPSTADYDLHLYGDNNLNYHYASSTYDDSISDVDFVVGDYNHNNRGDDHLLVNHYSGAEDLYRVHFDQGGSILPPDGVARSSSWSGIHVARVWEVPLFAGETVSFVLDITSGVPDLGMALFRSNGDDYWIGRNGAAWQRDNAGPGGTETYTYTVPEDDVYGLVIWGNTDEGGAFTIQIGPTPFTLVEEATFYSGYDLRLFNYDPNAAYWSVVGNRPDPGGNTTVRLFNDAQYTSPLETSDDYNGASPQNIDFIAADYNHASMARDYVRVINHGGTLHGTEWEHDADLIIDATSPVTWEATHVCKIWDMQVRAGQQYFIRGYNATTLDTGLFLFGSADGDYYKPRAGFASAWNTRPASEGGEWFWHDAVTNNWNGLVQIVNDGSTGSYQIWAGPQNALVDDVYETWDDDIVFNDCPVTAGYWHVFGARPSIPAEVAWIWLFGDETYSTTTFRAADIGLGNVSFVVGDFNHNAVGTERMLVRRYNDSSEFDLEFDGGNESFLFDGSPTGATYFWPAGDVAEAIDVGLSAGQEVSIEVEVLSDSIDLGMALFRSNGTTYYANTTDAVLTADDHGAGGDEAMVFTVPATDWYGLVIWNNNDYAGNFDLVIGGTSEVAVDLPNLPTEFSFASSPNPFRGSVDLQLALPQPEFAAVAVYDVSGRLVKRIEAQDLEAGVHSWTWDGSDDAGHCVAAGVYLARARTSERNEIRKLIRLQ